MRHAYDLRSASRRRYGGPTWQSEIGPGSDSYRREQAARRGSRPPRIDSGPEKDTDRPERRELIGRDGAAVTREEWSER